MEFTVEYYETAAGKCPVRVFLDELEASDPDDFAAVFAGLGKLRSRQAHREPLTKALGDGLFELRHVGKLNTRVLWFFMKGRRIVATIESQITTLTAYRKSLIHECVTGQRRITESDTSNLMWT